MPHRRAFSRHAPVLLSALALATLTTAAEAAASTLDLHGPAVEFSVPSPAPAFNSPATQRSGPPFTHLQHSPFGNGSRLWSITAGMSRDKQLGAIGLYQFSADHHVADDLALRVGGTIGYARPTRTPDGLQGGPELGGRWHFDRRGRCSRYLDGSVAAVWHQHSLTPESLRFNFDIQAGVGATYRLHEQLMLKGGLRWHHLSNARVRGKSHNLGYDGPMLYLGTLRPF